MEQSAISTAPAGGDSLTPVCRHCAAPVGRGQAFCCHGCEAAYALVNALPLPAEMAGKTVVLISPFVKKAANGTQQLTIGVQGIHCASCIRLIESALLAQPDMREARVNMSTGRLSMSWDGPPQRADAFARLVTDLGYRVIAMDASKAEQPLANEETAYLRYIAISGFASGNLMLLSVALWTTTAETMGMATRDLFHWISALIACPAVIYSGRPFFRSAFSALKKGYTNMDVPISLAIILACFMSLIETINHGAHVYFDSATMLVFFLLIGRYLDTRAKSKARKNARELLSMLSGSATVLEGQQRRVVPISELREGMEVLVATGEAIPADAQVLHGVSEVDMSLITGETMPQAVTEKSTVYAGTINLSAPLHIRIAKASDDSLLSDIVRLMEKAEQGQARYVRLADKAAKLYTPIVHVMALATFLGWWLAGGMAWQPALLIAITVLIITCPCALGLAVPVVQILASSRLMRRGILLKSGDALERLAEIDTVIFDKTGTLTVGQPRLEAVMMQGVPCFDAARQQALAIAASLAAYSKHPLSRAVSMAYDGSLLPVSELEEIPGKGLSGCVDGRAYQLGSRRWCVPELPQSASTALELWLISPGKVPICLTFSDQLRSDAAAVVGRLQNAGLKLYLLSGDRLEVVQHVANTLGMEHFHAALSPVDKCRMLQQAADDGKHTLMVGDGLNDAPALATASVSMSPASAMDITQNTADIVFQGDKLEPVITAWRIARRCTQLVKQNFALAVVYNIVAIPLAVAGYVTPLIAALAMSGSSLVVIANSFRLNRQKD